MGSNLPLRSPARSSDEARTASFPPQPGLLNVAALQGWEEEKKKKKNNKSFTTSQVSRPWEISSSQEALDFQNLHSSHRRAKPAP